MPIVADVRPGLRAFLLADSVLNTACGGRCYPGQLPQAERRPSIVYNEISDQGDHTMEGASGLARPRFQLDAWAETKDIATSLALLIKARLDGYKGTFAWGSNSPQDSVTVQGVFFDTGRDNYDDVLKLHGKSRDYIIFFAER